MAKRPFCFQTTKDDTESIVAMEYVSTQRFKGDFCFGLLWFSCLFVYLWRPAAVCVYGVLGGLNKPVQQNSVVYTEGDCRRQGRHVT